MLIKNAFKWRDKKKKREKRERNKSIKSPSGERVGWAVSKEEEWCSICVSTSGSKQDALGLKGYFGSST